MKWFKRRSSSLSSEDLTTRIESLILQAISESKVHAVRDSYDGLDRGKFELVYAAFMFFSTSVSLAQFVSTETYRATILDLGERLVSAIGQELAELENLWKAMLDRRSQIMQSEMPVVDIFLAAESAGISLRIPTDLEFSYLIQYTMIYHFDNVKAAVGETVGVMQ